MEPTEIYVVVPMFKRTGDVLEPIIAFTDRDEAVRYATLLEGGPSSRLEYRVEDIQLFPPGAPLR